MQDVWGEGGVGEERMNQRNMILEGLKVNFKDFPPFFHCFCAAVHYLSEGFNAYLESFWS